MREMVDLSGKTFGLWTVIEQSQSKMYGNRVCRRWLCKCVCGTVRQVDEKSLKSGGSTACGCTRAASLRDGAIKNNRTHGMTDTRIYRIYKHMMNRCYRESDIRYEHYGARGITVCDEWKSFDAFLDWAIASGYKDDLSIDRKDVNGNYCPNNCRWATVEEQANNKTNNRLFTYNGVTKNISQWAKEYDIPYKKLWKRLHSGWDIERALTT